MPVQKTAFMKSEILRLGSYSTKTITIYFYWPKTGSFVHFPSNITLNDRIIAWAEANTFEVLEKPWIKKSETFKDLLT